VDLAITLLFRPR